MVSGLALLDGQRGARSRVDLLHDEIGLRRHLHRPGRGQAVVVLARSRSPSCLASAHTCMRYVPGTVSARTVTVDGVFVNVAPGPSGSDRLVASASFRSISVAPTVAHQGELDQGRAPRITRPRVLHLIASRAEALPLRHRAAAGSLMSRHHEVRHLVDDDRPGRGPAVVHVSGVGSSSTSVAPPLAQACSEYVPGSGIGVDGHRRRGASLAPRARGIDGSARP